MSLSWLDSACQTYARGEKFPTAVGDQDGRGGSTWHKVPTIKIFGQERACDCDHGTDLLSSA